MTDVAQRQSVLAVTFLPHFPLAFDGKVLGRVVCVVVDAVHRRMVGNGLLVAICALSS